MNVIPFKGEGFLYAALYDNGKMKFGVSKHPLSRISKHDNSMELAGASRIKHFISKKTKNPYALEAKVKVRFASQAIHGREWLDGGVFDDVVSMIKKNVSPATDKDKEEHKKSLENASEWLKNQFLGEVKSKSVLSDEHRVAWNYANAIASQATYLGYCGDLLHFFYKDGVSSGICKLLVYLANYCTCSFDDIAEMIKIVSSKDFARMEEMITSHYEYLIISQMVSDSAKQHYGE